MASSCINCKQSQKYYLDIDPDMYKDNGNQEQYEVEPQPYENLKEGAGSQGPLDHLSNGLEGQARAAFIAKVYSLLSIELLITFSFCLAAQFSQAYRDFQANNVWLLILSAVLLIVTMIVAFCWKKAKVFPIDTILLLVFILSFSYIISLLCSAVVQSSEDNGVVPVAIAATVAITVALTLYAFLCKGHWLLWLGILLVCLSVVLVLSIASIFVHMQTLFVIICALCLMIYGIYLVILTKMIIGDQMGGFPLDSAIIASVFLYIYIMRIFVYLLAIFGGRR